MTAGSLTILHTGIRRDAAGRWSLNDCHRASGNDAAKKPANFLRLDTTQSLIAEIRQCSDLRSDPDPVAVINGGDLRGSYGCKELVYAYAMWISPAFYLTVIRTFDAVVQGRITAPVGASERIESARAAAPSVVNGFHLLPQEERQKIFLSLLHSGESANLLPPPRYRTYDEDPAEIRISMTYHLTQAFDFDDRSRPLSLTMAEIFQLIGVNKPKPLDRYMMRGILGGWGRVKSDGDGNRAVYEMPPLRLGHPLANDK